MPPAQYHDSLPQFEGKAAEGIHWRAPLVPGRGYELLKSIDVRPERLKAEARRLPDRWLTSEQQRAVIRHDQSEAPEVAFTMQLLPIGGAKDTVEVDQQIVLQQLGRVRHRAARGRMTQHLVDAACPLACFQMVRLVGMWAVFQHQTQQAKSLVSARSCVRLSR